MLYRTTIIGRFRGYTPDQLDEFRYRFSERGAWQELPDKDEAGWTWLPVTCDVDAATSADAVERGIRSYEADAKAADLGLVGAWNVEALPTEELSGQSTRKTYTRVH